MVKNKNSFFGKIQQKAEELKSEVPPLLKSKKDTAKSQSQPKPQSTTQARPSSQLLQGPTMEQLIEASLVDGNLTEQEKQVLYKKAQAAGWNLDEFNIVLDARLAKVKQERMEKAISSQPKSKKYGDVRKCPNCGALVEALTHSCKECGYEFADVEGNFSGKLMDRINQIRENFTKKNEEIRKYNADVSKRNAERGILKRKESFVSEEDKKTMYDDIRMAISTFQIPNTRAELFDFVMFLKPKIKKIKKNKTLYYEDMFGEVYEQKYNECIDRVRSLFSTDPIFAKILYEADAEKRRKKQRLMIIGGVSIFVIIIVIVILCHVL